MIKTQHVAGALAALGLMAGASSAGAAVFVSSTFGAPDPGPRVGETYIIDFDPGLEAGVTLTGNAAIVSGSLSGFYAAPAGDLTKYLTVPKTGGTGSVVMDFASFLGNRNVSGFSFYWGSIDTYNKLELLDRSGNVTHSIGGGAIPPSNGNQTSNVTNRRVNFDLTGAEQNLGALRLTSTNYAFEADTFSFAVVPEPGTWALMILGFGGAGAMLRRSRRLVAA